MAGAGLGLLLLAPGIATLWTAWEKLAAPIAPAAVPSRGPSRVDWEEGSRSPATQESEDRPKFREEPPRMPGASLVPLVAGRRGVAQGV